VKLTLTSDDDPQLGALTKRMREETGGSTGWSRLGKLLIKLGEFDKAEQVYKVLLDQDSNDMMKVYLYQLLGLVKDDQGAYKEAISFYEKSLEIMQNTLPPNHPSFATSYDNIGSVYISAKRQSVIVYRSRYDQCDRMNKIASTSCTHFCTGAMNENVFAK
jgi:tetratricopeptide (TPR) repeat protein